MIKKSILIIDDDIILLKTAEEILSDLYSVSVAKGGKQGIALLKKGIIPNLILLDIAMPEMDGKKYRLFFLQDFQNRIMK